MTRGCPSTSEVVRENIKALIAFQRQQDERRSWAQRAADQVTRRAGSMPAIGLHAVWFGAWVVVNGGLVPGVSPWDPFPFVLLTGLTSLEAIFLTLCILMSQNRAAELADRREELDVQINLLAEHELTRVLGLVDAIATRLGVEHTGEAAGSPRRCASTRCWRRSSRPIGARAPEAPTASSRRGRR